MSKWRILTILLGIIGAAFIAVAIVYWVEPAGSLPGFFPGHLAGSTVVHVKHGIASVVVGVLFCLGAWMASGRK